MPVHAMDFINILFSTITTCWAFSQALARTFNLLLMARRSSSFALKLSVPRKFRHFFARCVDQLLYYVGVPKIISEAPIIEYYNNGRCEQ